MPAKRVVYTDHEGSCEVVFYSVEALEGMLKKSILNIIKDNELLKVMKKYRFLNICLKMFWNKLLIKSKYRNF